MAKFLFPYCAFQVSAKKLLAFGLSIFLLLGSTAKLAAQTLPAKLWDKTFGGTFKDNAVRIKPTKDGGFILGGTSNSWLTGVKKRPQSRLLGLLDC